MSQRSLKFRKRFQRVVEVAISNPHSPRTTMTVRQAEPEAVIHNMMNMAHFPPSPEKVARAVKAANEKTKSAK